MIPGSKLEAHRQIRTIFAKSQPETHHPPPLSVTIQSSPGSIYFKGDQFPILWRFHVFTLTWSVQLYHPPISLKKLLSLPSFFRKYLMGFDDWLISLSFQPTGSNFSCQGFSAHMIWQMLHLFYNFDQNSQFPQTFFKISQICQTVEANTRQSNVIQYNTDTLVQMQ